MPYGQVKGMLTDIGTEELAHVEMISAILYQLTQNLSMADIKKSGFDTYFVDHTTGAFPQFASGTPFTTAILQVTGDALADLYEDLAAEQKARLSYDNILRLIDDPDVRDPIKFLREREVVHFQRFGDALRITQDNLDAKNFYAFNPSFDKKCNPPDTVPTTPCTSKAAPASSCGCTAAPMAPACGCAAAPVAPACGCAAAPAAPACGCAAVPAAPACGCAPAVTPVPVVEPACGCAQQPKPYNPCAKYSKRGRYIG